jgi:hypothetical protein
MFGKSGIAVPQANKSGFVRESVSLALPDLIMVELLEKPIVRGSLEYHPGHGGDYKASTWSNRTNYKGQTKPGWTVGLDNDYIRFADEGPSVLIDRDALKTPGLWKLAGSDILITNVYFTATPHKHGFFGGGAGGIARARSGMRLRAYLQLSENLIPGDYRLQFPPASGFGDYLFTYDDKTMYSGSIRRSDWGCRADEISKQGRLYNFIPGRPGHGSVDIPTEYGFTEFYIIDENGTEVGGPYPIGTGVSPSTDELWSFPDWPTNNVRRWNIVNRKTLGMPSTSDIGTVTNVTAGTPGTITLADGHPFVEGDTVIFGIYSANYSAPGISGLPECIQLVNDDGTGNTFEIFNPIAGTSPTVTGTFTPSLYAGPLANKVARRIVSNASGSWVHPLDFSGFAPATEGFYRLHIRGFACSDPFYVGADAWLQPAQLLAAGEYHQRLGCAYDGRFGYKRPVANRHGEGICTYYKSRFPVCFGHQGGTTQSVGSANYGTALTSELWLYDKTPENEIEACGEWADAGDYDVLSAIHLPCFWDIAYVYRMLSPEQRNAIVLNLPKSSDPSLYLGAEYAEIDDACDLLHMLVYPIAWLKRCQFPDGSVPGGAFGTQEGRSSPQGIGQLWDPCFLWYQPAYTAAPDHETNYIYAGCAAILGQILIAEGYTILGQSYIDSAVSAFAWAENLTRKSRLTTSTSVAQLSTGSKNFVVNMSNGFAIGTRWRISSRADLADNWMEGAVTNTTPTVGSGAGTVAILIDTVSETAALLTNFSDWDIQATDHDYYYYYDTLPIGGMRRRITVTGDFTSGSPIVTNIQPNTTGMLVGDYFTQNSGTTTIANGRFIKSIDGPNQITLRDTLDMRDRNGVLINSLTGNATATVAGVSCLSRVMGGGWTDAQYATAVHGVGTVLSNIAKFAAGARIYAASSMIRCPGVDAIYYQKIAEASHNGANRQGWDAMGWAEYLGMDGAGPAGAHTGVRDYLKAIILDTITRAPPSQSLLWLQDNNTQSWPIMWGSSSISGPTTHYAGANYFNQWSMAYLSWGSDQTVKNRLYTMIGDHLSWMWGMNAMNTPMVMGANGRYTLYNLLHDTSWIDNQASNGQGGAPAGIVPFGSEMNARGVLVAGFNNYGPGSPHIYTVAHTPGDTEQAARLIEPWIDSFPGWIFQDNRWVISDLEFGMTGVLENLALCLVMHMRGGNNPTTIRPYLFR